jgi:hypothetical protein
MHADPKTILLVAAAVVVFEALRRLNGGRVRGIGALPYRAAYAAKGPHGVEP